MKTKVNIRVAVLTGMVIVVLLTSLKTASIINKNMIGAWHYGTPGNHTVLINSETAFAAATYDLPGKKFISSYGGTWRIAGNELVRKIEWNSANPEEVGKELKLAMQLTGDKLVLKPQNETFTRIDDGKPGELAGAWIITGRYKNDTLAKSPVIFKSRRTMKILSGTRFQWIAYDIDSKKFFNSGGGTYTTTNGKYTENIEFFTKTAESVGKSLNFNYAFDKGNWRHSGLSTAGKKIDECWTRREALEK